MTAQLTTQQLREQLAAHLATVTPPPGDLDAVRRRSRSSRTRRFVGPGLLAVAAVGIGALVLSQTTGPSSPDPGPGPEKDVVLAAEGRLDLNEGLRAYASPSERLHLGGTSVELTPGMGELDTSAAATPYGLVYLGPDGRTHLLGESGRSEPIGGPSDTPRSWGPTAKADAERPHVAFAQLRDGDVTLTVYDLEERSVVATTDITCPKGCEDLVIDGIDSGAVFVRTQQGTGIWNYDLLESYQFAGPFTRVADVRNGVVLYDGPAPTENTDGWRLVPGAIDAQLTFDGEHILYWSSTLQPTSDGGSPIVLDKGPADGDGLAWWTVDTDGSILVAAAQPDKPGGNRYSGDNVVHDCELPSGQCQELGELVTTSGDPMFMGDDM